MIALFLLVFASFAATNIDNLLLLVTWLLAEARRSTLVFAGFMAGMVLLLVACILLGQLADLVPVAWLGYVGLIPIGIGLVTLRCFDYDKITQCE